MTTKLLPLKCWGFLIALFFVSNNAFSQDCDFTISTAVVPVSCPGNGQITVNLSNVGANLSDFRYSLSSTQVNIDKSTSNVFGGLGAGNYKIVVDAICNNPGGGSTTVSKTLQSVTVGSNYTTPDLGLVQGSFTSSTPYGTVPSFACSPTGQIQLRIENGVFPYSISITKDGADFRTDTFSDHMYTGTNPSRYDYKDYYTIANLPPGNYTFHVTDGCGYALPFVSGTVPSLSDTYPVSRAYIYRDPASISNNTIRFSLLNGINSDNNYYYYGFTQSQGTEVWWEYCISIDGGATYTAWKDVSKNGVVQETLSIPNYCSLYGKQVKVKVRDKACNKEYTKNFNITQPSVNTGYQYTTDASQSTPAVYDSCGYTSKKDILNQHTSSYYQQTNNYKANQLSNSSADFYYTPPLTIKVTNVSTGQVIDQTTQTTPAYNWRENINVTPDMSGVTINMTVTDANGCVISNRNQVIDYQEKVTTNGGTRYNTTWQVNSSAQSGDFCGASDRKISIIRQNPSADYLDSTQIHLVQSPQNNKYNFSALYLASTGQWTITKENPANTANIYAGNDVANDLEIAAPDLVTGTYVFTITTKCKTETITKNFTFPSFLSISAQPKYQVVPNCGFLDIIPTAGQVQADGANTATYFAVVSGPPGGYPTYAVSQGGKLELTIHGDYTIRMYSNVSNSSACGIKDTTITFAAENINFNYLLAYVCAPTDVTAHVNARGVSGKKPYTYTLYKDANQTIVLASDTIGDFASVSAKLGDELYMKIEDACGASFVASIDVVDMEAIRKAWFGNNNQKELEICQGDVALLNGISLGDVTYTWTGPNGFYAQKQNAEYYVPRGMTDPGWYYLEVENAFCPVVKDSIHLIIKPTPSVTILDNASICPGADYIVNLTPHGTGNISYTVAKESDNIITEQVFANQADGQLSTMTVSPLSTMKVWIKDVADEACNYTVPEDTITIQIKSISSSCNITAPSQQMCYDEQAQLTVSSTLDYPYTINWYSDKALANKVKSETVSTAGQQSTLNIPNLKQDTVFYVTAGNDNYCEYRPGVSVGSTNMANTTTYINCGESIRFYDSGGATGNYGNNEDLIHTFVSVSGDPVNISFDSFVTEDANFDKMYIYDGADINAPVLASQLGGDLTGNLPGPFVSTGDRLTIQFVSNFNNTFAGWEAMVGVKDGPVAVTAKVLDTINVVLTSIQPIPIHFNSSTTLNAIAGGGRGTSYQYQWFTSPDGSNWTLTSVTAASYAVNNLTVSTYYKVIVTDNSPNACAGQAEAEVFLNVADIDLTLELQTPNDPICPGQIPVTLTVKNNGSQTALNVLNKVLLPAGISMGSTQDIEILFPSIAAGGQQTEDLILTVDPSVKALTPVIKAQIWSCEQGDRNVNTVYGDWDWTRDPLEKDEDTLPITLKRVVTNNDITAANDSICYGDNAVLHASTAFAYPQTFNWYSDAEGTDLISTQTLADASTPYSSLTIPGLTKDTTVYVTFTNDDICPYTLLQKDNQMDFVMSDGLSDINIDQSLLFTDDGESDGNYSEDKNYTHTLHSVSGDPIVIAFSSFVTDESSNDILYLYDGSSTNAPLLATLTGDLTSGMPLSYTTTGSDLTISFQSHSTGTGWEAKIETLQQLKPVSVFVKTFADPATITATSVTICPDADVQLQASSTIAFPQTFRWYTDNLLTNEVYEEIVDGTTKTKSTYSLTNQTADATYYITVGNNKICNLNNAGLTPTGYLPAISTITITQPTVAITGADSVCVGATTTLSPTTGGVWSSSDNTIATVTNGGVVTGVAAGKAVFIFTDNTTGCFTKTDSVKVNPLPAITVNNIAICDGATADLRTAVTASAGSMPLFYSDQSGTLVGTPEAVPGITQNRTFYAKAQDDVSFCESSLKSFNVTVNQLPIVAAQDIAICNGSNVNLTTAIVNVVADTLLYYSDNGITPVPTPTSVAGITTDVTYYVKARNKTTLCESALVPFNITVNPAPGLVIGNNTNTVCLGANIDIEYTLQNAADVTITGLPDGVTYSLNGNALTISGLSTVTGAYNYTITTTGQAASCQAAAEQGVITINPNPVPAFNYSFDPLDNKTVYFFSQTTIPAGNIQTLAWDFGDSGTASSQQEVHTYTTSGQYDVTLTATSYEGCTASVQNTITTNANITANFEIDDAVQCFTGNKFTFTNTSIIQGTTAITYSWDFGDGTTGNLKDAIHSYAHAGVYTVVLSVTTDAGLPTELTQTATKTVTVHLLPPVTVQNIEICEGESVDLTTALLPVAQTTASYYWDPAGAAYINDPTNIADVESNTLFYVKLKYDATGCESPMAGFRVIVRPTPSVEVQNIQVCRSNNAVNIADAVVSSSPGSTLQYFRDILETDPVLSPTAVSGITMVTPFYVKAVYASTQCESKLKNFLIVPVVLPEVIVQDITVCTNGSVDLNSAVVNYQGSSVKFYSDVDATKPVSTTIDNITSPATYYARAEDEATGCKGEVKSFVVSVNPTPTVSVPNFVFCSGENVPVYSFTGNGTSYEWRRVVGHDFGLTQTSGTDVMPAFTAINSGIYPLEAIYEATPVYTANGISCAGEAQEFLITVNPMPVLAPIVDMVHCYGSVAEPYVFTGNIPDADYIWKWVGGDAIAAIPSSGEDFMPGFTALTNGTALTANYKVTADFSFANKTCNNGDTISFSITLLPEVILSISNADQTICSGAAISDVIFTTNVPTNNMTFNWERVSGYVPGLAASGTGNIMAQVLTNTGSSAVNALYSVTPVYNYNGTICEGAPKTFSITVIPEIHSNTVPTFTFCSGENVPAYSFDNDLSIHYTWTNEGGVDVGLPTSGEGPLPAFTAQNNGVTAVTTQYKVTAHQIVNNVECSKDIPVSITVNPAPMITPVAGTTLCNNALLAVTFTGNGTTYEWERIAGANVGLPLQGTGNMNQVLVNNTPDAQTATYKVVPVVGACKGTGSIFDITVLPTPSLSSTTDAGSICSGSNFNYTAASNTKTAVFSWTRTADPNINGGAAGSGTNNTINEVLTNSSTTPVVVTYQVSMTVGTCTTVTTPVTVTVVPTLIVNPVASVTKCNNDLLTIVFTGDGTTYQWERTGGANIGLPLTGSGNISQLVTNATNAPVTATYKVVPVAGLCQGAEQLFDITVLPTPVLSSSKVNSTICSGETFAYMATSKTENVVFGWSRIADPDINGGAASSGSNAAISEALANTSGAPVTVTYEISLAIGSCTATTEQVTVTVNPAPEISIDFAHLLCGGETSVAIPYTTSQSATMQYAVKFSDVAIAAGFTDQGFATLPSDAIVIPAPSPVATGYYAGVITVMIDNCTKDYPFEIKVLNPFKITEQPQSLASLCSGISDITLSVVTDQENLTYQWYHNGQAIPGATSDTYSTPYDSSKDGEYYVEISSICMTLQSDIVYVTVNPVSIAMEWDNVMYVKDYDHQFTAFQWYKNGSRITVNGNAQYYAEERGLDGEYYVRCYYPDNSYIETCPVTFTGTSYTTSSLYPNPAPARSAVSVSVESNVIDMENAEIEIFDMAGKMVHHTPASGSITSIVAPEMPGNYIVRIKTSNKDIIQRMIVK